MSASRDQTQKTTFVFNNLYQLYKKNIPSPVKVQTAETKSEAVDVLKDLSVQARAELIEKALQAKQESSSQSGLRKGVLLQAAVLPSSQIIKETQEAGMKSPEAEVKVYRAPAFIKNPAQASVIQSPEALPKKLSTEWNILETKTESSQTITSLKKNLKDLENLHERLKFMLKEIEELTKK